MASKFSRIKNQDLILLDADALVAQAKNDDSNHQKAILINEELQQIGVRYVLSPFTAAEAVTVISYKISQSAAVVLLKAVRELDLSVIELRDKSLADTWFKKQTQKGTSYFDCYSMALMQEYQIRAIFSFDSVYAKNGFLCLDKS